MTAEDPTDPSPQPPRQRRRTLLVALHALVLALFVPLGLVLSPGEWTVAIGVALTVALVGIASARRRPGLAGASLVLGAVWWFASQALLGVAG